MNEWINGKREGSKCENDDENCYKDIKLRMLNLWY